MVHVNMNINKQKQIILEKDVFSIKQRFENIELHEERRDCWSLFHTETQFLKAWSPYDMYFYCTREEICQRVNRDCRCLRYDPGFWKRLINSQVSPQCGTWNEEMQIQCHLLFLGSMLAIMCKMIPVLYWWVTIIGFWIAPSEFNL